MLEQERAAAGGVVEVADLKTELRTSEMARQDLQVRLAGHTTSYQSRKSLQVGKSGLCLCAARRLGAATQCHCNLEQPAPCCCSLPSRLPLLSSTCSSCCAARPGRLPPGGGAPHCRSEAPGGRAGGALQLMVAVVAGQTGSRWEEAARYPGIRAGMSGSAACAPARMRLSCCKPR